MSEKPVDELEKLEQMMRESLFDFDQKEAYISWFIEGASFVLKSKLEIPPIPICKKCQKRAKAHMDAIIQRGKEMQKILEAENVQNQIG